MPEEPKRVFVTGLHSLRSDKPFDYSQYISEGTHITINFTIYEDPNNSHAGWTSYRAIISDQELFELLKDRAMVEVHPGRE